MRAPLTEHERSLLTLQPGQQVPLFSAPSAQGRDVALWDYKQRRHLALFFLHDAACDRCRTVLCEIAACRGDYAEQEAEPVAVLQEPAAAVEALARELDLTFPLLADANGDKRRRYLALPEGERAPLAVFVVDRYSRLWEQAVVPLHDELPAQSEVLDWFTFINMRCSL